jgi:hypothetical protein
MLDAAARQKSLRSQLCVASEQFDRGASGAGRNRDRLGDFTDACIAP